MEGFVPGSVKINRASPVLAGADYTLAMVELDPQPDSRAAGECPWWAGNLVVAGLWVLAGLVLLFLAWRLPLERTQEARVLESAREMLGGGWRGWMVPHANGVVRLHKPPLAYWLAAGSFKVFGVSVLAGRLPMAISGWLTLGATWWMARWLFNRRAAFLAAAMLAGTLFFIRLAALAETDVLTMLFVTVAVGGMWRGSRGQLQAEGEEGGALSPQPSGCGGFGEGILWHQLGAVAMAGAVLSKGPPAVFPVIFLIGLAAIEKRWAVLWRWVASGALLTMALLALPWWLYVHRLPEWATIGRELSDLTTGRDHPASFLAVAPFAIKGVLPWAGFVLLGVWLAVSRWRAERAVGGVLIWVLAILAPLLVIPQKQEHYLMPLLPALLVLAGSAVDRALSWRTPSLSYMTGGLLAITMGAGLCGGMAIAVVGYFARHRIIVADMVTAGAIVLLMGGTLFLYRRDLLRAAMPAGVVAGMVSMALVLGLWSPTLKAMSFEQVADGLRKRYGDGPYAFYQADDLRLCFHMRRVIEVFPKPQQLADAMGGRPGLVVIHEEDEKTPPLSLPGLVWQERFVFEKKAIGVYRASR